VEAAPTMIIPGSDEEKEYLKYLLSKHKHKKNGCNNSESSNLEDESDF